jgi:ribosomal protein L14E/L6E/L27E
MNIATGSVVVSLAGHDKGGIFAVIGFTDENHVQLVDGKLRKQEKPKIKKLKHLVAIGRLELPEPSAASNRELRRELKKFSAADKTVAEGGI